MNKKIFTSESVTEGHPDKICDQISDAVLDEILKEDKNARVACETVTTTGMVLVMGEITTQCYADIPKIAREVVRDIGYNNADYGFDYNTCAVLTSIDEQSPDISNGVSEALETRDNDGHDTGAGDQGMMFGYACDETPELMPMPISLAHALAKNLARVRKENVLDFLRPDGKTQVSVEYDGNTAVRIDTIIMSTQHCPEVSQNTIFDALTEEVICKTIPKNLIDKETKILINPSGRFVIGGPHGDSGLTGRKIIVDTYGGIGRHGGGCFSGKDPTKVDRSGAYAARYIAKNVVAAGLAKKCELQIAYAIGMAKPVSVYVDTFGTALIDEREIERRIIANFDMRPAAIIDFFKLRNPIYRQLAAYGHMGREDLGILWEGLDLAEKLK